MSDKKKVTIELTYTEVDSLLFCVINQSNDIFVVTGNVDHHLAALITKLRAKLDELKLQ